MISSFFITRPRFALVLSVVMIIAGLLAIRAIPVAQYPPITPPEIQVTAAYPGASAEVVASSVAAPIEAEVNGVPGMLYMSSTSSNTGSYTLTVTFAVGTDPAIAQVNVQNRVALATPRLPPTVTQQGVSVRTRSTNMLLAINVYSPRGTRDEIFLANYATINVRDALARVDGVGEAGSFSTLNYAMRIWLDPNRLTALGITASEVAEAVRSQNALASAGLIGSPPAPDGQQLQLTVLARGRLASPEEFGNVIIRTNPEGGVVRLRDVARVELGAQDYGARSSLNGQPSATVVIYQAPGANALDVAAQVRAELERLSQRFPEDVAYAIVFDTTRFVSATIEEIVFTLGITFLLVVAVTYLFLQDWRATLIPTLTIPVSLIGGFAALYALGYSANTITLFALILAIGLVVDDAIIVVENVQRHLEEDPDLPAPEATRRAMGQITGPVIASTLVLAAVFVPVAFLPGITGQLYRQFAVTITVTVLFSAVNALTLSPALCALLLRPPRGKRRGPLGWFNTGLDRARGGYVTAARWLARRLVLAVLLFLLVAGGAGALFRMLPTGFLPPEDQGYFFVNVQLPNAASLNRTQAVLEEVSSTIRRAEGVADVIAVSGFSLLGGAGSNGGLVIVTLRPWDERTTRELSLPAILARLQAELLAMPQARITAFNPPAIPGLGATGGFDFRLQALEGQSPLDLAATMRGLLFAANQQPELAAVFSTYTADVPQIAIDIDRARAELLGVSPSEIFRALQAHLGSQYVDDFNLLSRVFQVRLQDEAQFRGQAEQIDRLHVRSRNGELVPLRSLLTRGTALGPSAIARYNLFPAAAVNGQAALGYSTGEALLAMERVAAERLPAGYGFEWTGLALQERQAGGQVLWIFGLALLFAYLFLVAQYESWIVPVSVMLSVAVGVLGALAALWIAGIDNNVYAQIGLTLLIGLAAKNAILIVEFAKHRRDAGVELIEAAAAGTEQRFRPVLMTAFAFILGVLPLVVAAGAGAASRRAIGTTVFGGMLVATVLGVVLIPALYVLVQSLRESLKTRLGIRPGARGPQQG